MYNRNEIKKIIDEIVFLKKKYVMMNFVNGKL
jgi:hypothetical protein